MAREVVRVDPPDDEEMAEQWSRDGDDPELLGLTAWLPQDDSWRVCPSVAEFVREEPLETEMAEGIERALASVPGVTAVWREDREQWVAEGSPSGRALAVAAAEFVDAFSEKASIAVRGEPSTEEGDTLAGTLALDGLGWEFSVTLQSGTMERFRFEPDSAESVPLPLEEAQRRAGNFVHAKTRTPNDATWSQAGSEWRGRFRLRPRRRRYEPPGEVFVRLVKAKLGWRYYIRFGLAPESRMKISPMPGEAELPLEEAKSKALREVERFGGVPYLAQWE